MPTPVLEGPEFVVPTTISGNQDYNTVAALPDGRFVVAWTDRSALVGDTDQGAIRAQIYATDGTPLGGEILVNTTTSSSQFDPDIGVLQDGSFVIAWSDGSATGGDTSLQAIRAQRFDSSGAKAGGELLVNTSTVST
ncbi:hypothetical protein AB9K41_07475, partial [Cribrihabitans sp. XS_ASV171]